MVHAHKSVLDKMPEMFQAVAMDTLRKQGVELLMEDRVTSFVEGEGAELKSGKTIMCDVYISAMRDEVNSQFMDKSKLDAYGFIIVNNTFKVEVVKCTPFAVDGKPSIE